MSREIDRALEASAEQRAFHRIAVLAGGVALGAAMLSNSETISAQTKLPPTPTFSIAEATEIAQIKATAQVKQTQQATATSQAVETAKAYANRPPVLNYGKKRDYSGRFGGLFNWREIREGAGVVTLVVVAPITLATLGVVMIKDIRKWLKRLG